MKKEHQQVEWKETWRDEYLKWISGFANAEGGVLVIGTNDSGKVVGVADARKLLVDLPNKVRDVFGILVKVNLRRSGTSEYVEIVVDPYPYPVSYKGEYHIRSGSTKQELKGAALGRFLLRKVGRHWDGVPLPNLAIKDLSRPAINTFRQLARQADALECRRASAGLDRRQAQGEAFLTAIQSRRRQCFLSRRHDRSLGTGNRAHDGSLPSRACTRTGSSLRTSRDVGGVCFSRGDCAKHYPRNYPGKNPGPVENRAFDHAPRSG
jgi:Putative DNA-binding domain